MSTEDIRTLKALALLEFTETEQLVEKLKWEAKCLGKEFQSLGKRLEDNPVALLECEESKLSYISISSAYSIARRLREAQNQLAKAANSKAQFESA